MNIGDALQRRLAIYEPFRCDDWDAFRATITATTPVRDVWLSLPGFRRHPGRVFGRKVFHRWIARQLELAARAAQRTGE